MEITTKQLDHHGLVAGTFDKFEMGEVIEKRIPKVRNFNLSTSTIIKAMIILGLGFVDRRLYFAGSYFENWDVEKLLGEVGRKTLTMTLLAECLTRFMITVQQNYFKR
ncbi:MAG: hypothetical protein C0176_05620 [Mesoaciditoga sp.]|nr:MAG: hypothetical protein C0176_05620 [Mesoaciditoga sp.]